MPQKPLPTHPDLDHFRHQARDLRRAQRDQDAAACQRIREFHPRHARATDAQIAAGAFTLADAQLTVAREYGFSSWARLKADVERGDFADPGVPMHERIADAAFRQAVERIDAGDEAGLQACLGQDPSLAFRRTYFAGGGYFAHPTLLGFVAENPIRHGRLPANVVAIARILLDAGALADDGTLGLVASGRVARECLAQIPLIDLLCARGADPNRSMAGALTHGEFAAAEALIRHGARVDLSTAAALGRQKDATWLLPTADEEARHLALAFAAQHGRLEIVRLLLEAGVDPSRYNPIGAHAHSTPLHQAACYGHLEVVRLLVERGARLNLKDTLFHGTPLGWAEHGGQKEIAAYLRSLG